ncbi:methyl-accepting chemotaxis protein [Undibacterium sp.]|jgi:methyl-accepting chemotaxis protein|uniref:methyl-accepting chemotaxis protein n=1 Tax=Undibacterium sp. TaxID=1914977 RepID=UPI002C5B9690|nr:methyl-accepting chemotaxis protein [Undibacterium sp.]HTD06227.1 methyl-accepting chemotaxis protein [Undibacterium sp.]
MLSNISIKSRLICVFTFFSLLLIIIGGAGLYSLRSANTSLQVVYADRMVSVGRLDSVIKSMLDTQVRLGQAISGDPDQFGGTMDAIEKNGVEGNKIWADYAATSLTPAEKELADKFVAEQKIFFKEGLKPVIGAMLGSDVKRAADIYQGRMTETWAHARDTINALIQLQLDEAKNAYEKSQRLYTMFNIVSIGSLALGLLFSVVFGVWLIRSVSRPLEYAVRIASNVASGDLSQRIDVTSRDETGKLLTALKNMNDSLIQTVSGVRTGTEAIATASNQLAAGNMDLSVRTEKQAANLEKTTSSLVAITSTVKQNAGNAKLANKLVITASEFAKKGGQVVGEVVGTMAAIRERSRKIVDIIGVIDGIAFQTNILALNAAVEAARAGEQGRGFAVVATEVRNLAQRSAAAAKEIKALISDSVETVGAGSKLVDEAGATMDQIVISVGQVANIMGEISAASEEQRVGIDEINLAVGEMDNATQQNAALVEEAAAAAASMRQQAANLLQAVSVFQFDRDAGSGNTAHVSSDERSGAHVLAIVDGSFAGG